MTPVAAALSGVGASPHTLPALDTLPGIGLGELLERSALQTRVDRKYVVTPDEADRLVALSPAGTRALDIEGARTFGYTSTYLDTPDLVAYHRAAHRRRRRFKVRSRRYDGTGLAFLEVKTRTGAHTVKARLEGLHVVEHRLTDAGRGFLVDALSDAGIAPDAVDLLLPVLRTHYRRSTLHLAHDASRVTIDRELSWHDAGTGAMTSRPDLVVVETKSAGAASSMDRLLWSRGVRPTRISKYATGLAALDPDLPHNRWSRTLRRHF